MARILSVCVASMLCGLSVVFTPTVSWGETITATGIGVLPANSIDPASAPLVLSASVEGEGADANSAIVAANRKLSGLKAALEKVGVASSSFQLTNFYVYPRFEPSPTDPSAPPTITKHEAYIGIQVIVAGVEKAGAAINAALGAGVINVSTYIAAVSGQSSAGDAAVAVGEAMGQARTLATAAAASAGVKLGRLVSIEIKPATSGLIGATVFVGATQAGVRGLNNSGQAIEATATYEALP
jgi:uncharacterized protein YggE